MEILINNCYGRPHIHKDAMEKFHKRTPTEDTSDWNFEQYRAHPELIKIFKEMGTEKFSGRFGKIKLVEIPDDIEWVVEEYDGMEWVAEKHRTWC